MRWPVGKNGGRSGPVFRTQNPKTPARGRSHGAASGAKSGRPGARALSANGATGSQAAQAVTVTVTIVNPVTGSVWATRADGQVLTPGDGRFSRLTDSEARNLKR